MSLYVARVVGVSTGTSAKTLVQVAPATNNAFSVVEFGISFASVTSGDVPVQVDLMRQTDAGTSSSLTLVNMRGSDSKSPAATAFQTFTAEPTSGNILGSWQVTPIGGLFVMQYPMGREPEALTQRIAVRVTAPQSESATAYMVVEE